MNLSVIVPDRTIVKDGAALVFDFPAMAGLRALQWNGQSGTLEFNSGPQIWFDNQAIVQPYLDAYAAEAARIGGAQA
jgi:hypothetical protein